MRKKVIILGSTGSIGKNTIEIIKKDKKNFDIKLLSTNKNITEVIKQAKEFSVKHIIISDYKKFVETKKKYKKLNINFYNSFSILDKILNKQKIFYSMISLVGLDGLNPTLKLIKYTKNIAIVNKESLICGWNLIKNQLKKFNTNFIPIDSEHFSISELINNKSLKTIEKIYITASGGPFLDYSKSKLSKVSVNDALNHPNWKMGKKISIDSATMMNKVFEVIEAKNIFNIRYNKISILIHPKSYIHALIKFNNGQIKILAHEPDMKIPIHNSLYLQNPKKIITNDLNLNILNNLSLQKIDYKKYPTINIIKFLPKINSLYETALVTINDYFVFKFLENKINFRKLISLICKYSNHIHFTRLKKIPAQNIKDIYKTREYVRYKLDILGI
jgi:1-deoxy-D-xylulose-5-phosphate reductoisomerase